MKKILSTIISILLLLAGTTIVYAAPKTNVVETEFYVQRFGIQMDENGTVSSRDKAYFTPCVYTDKLTKGQRDQDYTVVYKEGSVSSDDVIKEVVNKPNDADIFKLIQETYENKGYILSSNGKVVDWSKFNTDNYEMRWYVLKMEDIWHVDGVIIEIETKEPVQIPSEDDEDYIPPEDIEKEEEDKGPIIPKYTNNYAYIFGYNDTQMGPDGSLLRCELSAMIHRLVKQNDMLDGFYYNKSNVPFYSDIEGEWFRSAIEFMAYKGAFNTEKGSNINPYVAVTRGEAFKLICIGLGFTDDTTLTVDEYAEIMKEAGYIQGDENGDLNVSDLITRAEFCTIYNRVTGRDKAGLVTADGEEITAKTYGFTDLTEDKWYYETMLKATSAYDENGYVDIEKRGIRNNLDDYE